MSFIIFDTEYIADKGLYEKGFNGWKNREVIQIAAIKVGENLQVEDKLDFYTLPVKHTEISAYFTDVTGITNEFMHLHGVDFVRAYEAFFEFSKGLNCYSHAWGSMAHDKCDGNVLDETLSYYRNKNNFSLNYLNIAPWFQFQYQKNQMPVTGQASGEIATILGLAKNLADLNLNPHNAFYDVYSILEGLKYFHFTQSDYAKLYGI